MTPLSTEIFRAHIGHVVTGPTTETLRLRLYGAGGGGSGEAIAEPGKSGEGGDVVCIIVFVKPSTRYAYVTGRGGKGGVGRVGGRTGGNTTFKIDNEIIVALGGRGGRASGVFSIMAKASGVDGGDGALMVEQFEGRLMNLAVGEST